MPDHHHIGYVLVTRGPARGKILVQVPDDNQWGVALCDDEQSWPGGFGVAEEWRPISDAHPRVTRRVREALGWIVDEARAERGAGAGV